MRATYKTALVVAFSIVAVLLLLFGSGMMTGTRLGDGMMGNGAMGGVGSIWLVALLVVVLGIVLFSALLRKKRVGSPNAGSGGA